MTDMHAQDWLAFARELFTLAKSGQTYSTNAFDQERYKRLMEMSEELTANAGNLPAAEVNAAFAMQQGYPTPKIDIRAAVFRDGEVLLVKELADGLWSMPGGWADLGDGPVAMAVREAYEETGLDVKVEKLVAVYNHNTERLPLEFFHCYKMLFLCSITGGQLRPSYETPEVGFFPFDDLPPLSIGRTQPRMLQEAWSHHNDRNRPTWFE